MSLVLETLDESIYSSLLEANLVHHTTGEGLAGILGDMKLKSQRPAMGGRHGVFQDEDTSKPKSVSFSIDPYYSHVEHHGPSLILDHDKIAAKSNLISPTYAGGREFYTNDKGKTGVTVPHMYSHQEELRHIGDDIPLHKHDIKGIIYHWSPLMSTGYSNPEHNSPEQSFLQKDFHDSHDLAKKHNIPFTVATTKHSLVLDDLRHYDKKNKTSYASNAIVVNPFPHAEPRGHRIVTYAGEDPSDARERRRRESE